MERKLAAILAADVVGYSRLMEQDEAGTFERLRAHRKELFEPEIARHYGRIFKLMGDGLLAEFASAVNAVECAIAVQQGMTERNVGLPDGQRIDCRIAVNLGDVIVENDAGAAMDMHGDGVIIANRLQALAEPGDVLISGNVYEQLKKKIGVGFEFLGQQRVKNIAEPVPLYRILRDPAQIGKTIGTGRRRNRAWLWPAIVVAAVVVLAVGALAWTQPWKPKLEPALVENMALPLPDRPSIAVLPFANMSDDPKQEYFADGMTDDLITQLSKLSGLFVISRNSTFVYKGKNVPPKQVSEELGVRYVLEGSVQRAGNQLRINAQLIDALSGGHAWADRFDGSVEDVFALQDKVTQSIADALAIKLNAAEMAALNAPDTAVPGAYDAYLRGMEHFRHASAADFAKAIPEFEEAIRLDPGFGRAHAALALLYLRVYSRGYAYDVALTPAAAFDLASEHVRIVRNLSPAAAHQLDGYIAATEGRVSIAIDQFKEAIALNPGDAWNYGLMGWALTGDGRPAEALEYFRTAMRLNPNDAAFLSFWLGLAQFGLQQFDVAAGTLESASRANSADEFVQVLLAATYGHLGRLENAKSAVSQWNEIQAARGNIALTVETAPHLGLINRQAHALYATGLKLAGVPESFLDEAFTNSNGMSGEELRALVFGHQLQGRDFWLGTESTVSVTEAGDMTTTGLFWYRPGRIQFHGDQLCLEIGTSLGDCATIVRNPGGTKQKANEYIWVNSRFAFPFWQVE